MIYKKVTINNFRGIKHLEIDDLSMVNIILGQNNCGKTSILEALFLLTGYNNPQLVLNIDYFRNLLHNEGNDFSFIFHNLDYRNGLSLVSELHNKDTVNLNIVPNNNTKPKVFSKINNSSITNANYYESVMDDQIINNSVNEISFNAEIKGFQQQRREFKSVINFNQKGKDLEFTTQPDSRNPKITYRALFQSPTSNVGGQTPRRLEKLIIGKKKEELISFLRLLDARIAEIATLTNGMIYLDIGANSLIPSNLMGDGFLKFLTTIINLHEVRNGILLIDEIDNGLHFKALKNLWRIILKTAKSENIQLFITTHSKEALLYLKEVLEEEGNIEFQDKVRWYTISKLPDSNLKSYKYDFASFENAIENDIEIRGEV